MLWLTKLIAVIAVDIQEMMEIRRNPRNGAFRSDVITHDGYWNRSNVALCQAVIDGGGFTTQSCVLDDE